jgi:hypothetical protein
MAVDIAAVESQVENLRLCNVRHCELSASRRESRKVGLMPEWRSCATKEYQCGNDPQRLSW